MLVKLLMWWTSVAWVTRPASAQGRHRGSASRTCSLTLAQSDP